MGRIARAVPPPQPIATTARMSHGTQPFRRTLRHLAVVSTLVAALVGAAYAGLSWRVALERRQWLATLEQADAQSLRPLLARAGRYGPEGWSAAASLLASTDSAVAAEASAIVLSWIDDPRPLTPEQQQQRLLAVAASLADQAHDASDAGRPRLRQVAMRLASVAANQTGPLATQCLAHCQKALDVVTTDRQALASHATPTRFTTRSAAPTVDSAARAPVDPKSPHSLGEFPIDAASRLPLPQLATVVNEPARIRDPVDEEQFSPTPNQDVPSNAAGPLLLAPQRQRPRLVPTPRQPAQTSDRDSRRGTLMRHESAPLNTQTESTAAGPSPELAPFSAQHNPDPRSAAQAVDDLRRRGYSDFEIELGRMATSPDVYQRRRLAEMLPRLAGVDPRRWLRWLSFDEDAVVRRTVVGWMITTGEASLLARARELAVGDPDDQVRQAAQRALEGAK